jgi:hypothetical protein
VLVAEYVAADLLRAGATETGHREDAEYPDSADITRYRQQLSTFARRLLLERGDRSPWYFQQQAMLYLASIGDHSVATTQAAELENYRILHQALLYSPCKEKDFEKALPLALVGQQLAPEPDRFAAWLIESLRATKSPDVIERCVLAVGLNRPDLMQVALRTRSGRSASWRPHVPSSLKTLRATVTRRSATLVNNVFLPLQRVISGHFNEFAQENALLALAKAVLEADGIEEALENGLHVRRMNISCKDWSLIQALPNEEKFLTISFEPGLETDPLYERPPWVELECAWLYGLGRILRSCITGEFDFTAARYLATEDLSRYWGLRSTWFKRRFGLLNTGRGLLDEPAPISPWLSSLLSVLLQWPGTDIKGESATRFLGAKTRIDILDVILERITEQRALYGGQSGYPHVRRANSGRSCPGAKGNALRHRPADASTSRSVQRQGTLSLVEEVDGATPAPLGRGLSADLPEAAHLGHRSGVRRRSIWYWRTTCRRDPVPGAFRASRTHLASQSAFRQGEGQHLCRPDVSLSRQSMRRRSIKDCGLFAQKLPAAAELFNTHGRARTIRLHARERWG